MRVLSASILLDAWERCLDAPALLRASTLLASASDQSEGDPRQWPIATRDAALFDLREQLFGRSIEAIVACAKCGEHAELEFLVEDIRNGPSPSAPSSRHNKIRVVEVDGRRIRYRAPTSEDLLAIAGCSGVETARSMLIERCIKVADRRRQALSQAALERALELIAIDQAGADVEITFDCPACSHRWASPFDIAAFLWREVDDWARGMVRDIHLFASRYGWSEAEILSMSARRREQYRELLCE
jgi:hypothetical protein